MDNQKHATLGNSIFSEIDDNDYLNELYEDILFNYSVVLFGMPESKKREINIEDALQFTDILSKSTDASKADSHRIWAQEIVALLKAVYPEHQIINVYLSSILSNIGNFRGLTLSPVESQGQFLLDRFYTEFSKDLMSIPAEPELQFFRSQKEVYDRLTEPYFSYSGPTSMGKSFIMRMFIKKQIMDGEKHNFAILVPTKALINEVYSNIIDDLKIDENRGYLAENNYTIVTSSGALQLKRADKNYIFVLTPERLLYLLIGHPSVNIDFLFIDEAHKISANDSRSTFYYKVIDMLARRNGTRIIFASPNIPNPEVYLHTLPNAEITDSKKLTTTFSPVSQLKYLVDLTVNTVKVYNPHTQELTSISKSKKDLDIYKLINIVRRKNNTKTAQSIIYFNSKQKVVATALRFAETIADKQDDELHALAKEIKSEVHDDFFLADMIKKGIAYHIGHIPASIRIRIEELYRNQKIHTIFCTSTLLEGVNLPADNLFITTYNKGRGKTKMKVVDFKNLVGRVGRINYNLYGNVFLVRLEESTSTDNFINLLKQDVPSQELSIVSSLSQKQKEQIVACLIDGDISLENVKLKTQGSYSVIRKFAVILLRDIIKGNNSVVYKAFSECLSKDAERKIKEVFKKESPVQQDDDINISVDQTKNLYTAISNGTKYPALNHERKVDYAILMEFLGELSQIFRWGKYEKSTVGNVNRLSWYAVILRRWMNGHGLSFIISESIRFHENNPDKKVSVNGVLKIYDRSKLHKNSIIAETLEAIEQTVLFTLSNYFLKFSEAYKSYHKIERDMRNDWFEYIEYGTTNPLSILLQRNGFTRETAMYIRQHRSEYVTEIDSGNPQLRKSLASCGKHSVETEVADMLYNNPDLFV